MSFSVQQFSQFSNHSVANLKTHSRDTTDFMKNYAANSENYANKSKNPDDFNANLSMTLGLLTQYLRKITDKLEITEENGIDNHLMSTYNYFEQSACTAVGHQHNTYNEDGKINHQTSDVMLSQGLNSLRQVLLSIGEEINVEA